MNAGTQAEVRQMDSSFRPLKASEKHILTKLLESEFPGRDELRRQLESTRARQIFDDGTLELRVDSGPLATVKNRVPIEAQCPDGDGVMIHLLLHVVHGMMDELEVFKEDGSKSLCVPTADKLTVLTPILTKHLSIPRRDKRGKVPPIQLAAIPAALI